MKLIDLTMPLGPNTPVYPGDPRVELETIATVDSDGYQDSVLRLDTHNGTHLDAPGHMMAGGVMLDAFGVDRLVGRGVLVDGRRGFTLAGLEQAALRPGDIVLLWTGFSDDYMAADYYDKVPKLDDESVAYLTGRQPSIMAVDAGSFDAEPFPLHKAWLKKNILLAENLVGLSVLEGQTFNVIALPLKLSADGAPARIIAQCM